MTIHSQPVKIILAEDHPLFLEGLEKLLNENSEKYLVIAKASNGQLLLDLLPNHQPDLLLIDINMPVMSGIEAGIRIKRDYPSVKIIFLSLDNSPSLLRQLHELQFDGFAAKDVPVNILTDTIDQVMQNKKVFPEIIINKRSAKSFITGDKFDQKLSPRQLEVIRLITEGVTTNKEIAAALSLSVLTVETHLKNIFQIVDVKNKLELINALKN